jgi:DNA-binding transcriptional LysR family regulator
MSAPPIGDTEFRLLRVFRAVAECGGVTAAEAELGLARSTISTHIAALETRLGLRLCDRGRGGFALTEEGRLVYREAVRLMSAVDSFRAEIGGARNKLVGEFNLVIIDGILTLPEVPLIAALAAFRARAPDVHVTIGVLSTDEMERRVLDGTAHVAFSAVHGRKAGLSYRIVATETQYLYCGRGHPLFDTPDDEIDAAVLSRQAAIGRTFLDLARTHEGPLPREPAASANNLEAMLILIRTGAYVGNLPRQVADPHVAEGTLKAIRPDLTRHDQDFALVTRDTPRRPPVVSAFLEAYAALAQDSGADGAR